MPISFDQYYRNAGGVHVGCLTWGPPSKILVEWQLKETQENLSTITFTVERSEDNSFDDFVVLTSAQSYSLPHEFVDTTAPFEGIERKLYYRVKAIRPSPAETVTSQISTWFGNPDLIAQEIIDRHSKLLERVSGVPFIYFRQRTFGPRCSKCWDPVSKRSKRTCNECYGNGFAHPFHDPVAIYLDKSPTREMIQMTDLGQVPDNQVAAWTTMYPMFSSGDVLLEPQSGRRYKVAKRDVVAEKRGVPIQQMLMLEELMHSQTLQQLKVSDIVLRALVDNLVSERGMREF
jgi:hypothetical protein